jgi:DNA-directed RNA polymerase subunit N (RpoN/RPB10)
MIKQVIEIPQETFNKIEAKLNQIDEIHEILRELGKIETPQHYSVKEFMKLAKIGRNKFEEIKDKLQAVRVSPRKIMIPHSDLVRWFNGDFI